MSITADDAGSMLVVGEVVTTPTRRFHVSAADVDAVGRMRAALVDVARARGTMTYGDLVEEAELPYPPRRLGRLLVLISEDCDRRGEPTLAAIVVTRSTGEVGDGYGAGASDDRADLYSYWQREVR